MSNFQRFMRSRGQSESIVLLSLTLFDIDFNFFKNIFSLRMNLYELIKKNNSQGFSLALIKR